MSSDISVIMILKDVKFVWSISDGLAVLRCLFCFVYIILVYFGIFSALSSL